MTRRLLALGAALFVAGCGESGPPLDIADVRVYAPLPGSRMSVAYMTMTNNTGDDMLIERVTSPDFDVVETHESLLTDGVAKMRPVEKLDVPAGGTIVLEEGGIHLMLIGPREGLVAGEPVALRVHYGTDGTVLLTTTLRARVQPGN